MRIPGRTASTPSNTVHVEHECTHELHDRLLDAPGGTLSETSTHESTRPLNSTTARTSWDAHWVWDAPLLEPFLWM